ncbi:homoserine kinase [Canibacter sp. lx-72]|uniref:homoserine kinase n=1 Tax=Canibacter zhuwentaonis TaxID=2837491 RepID=UPI001BDC8A38|nr:homoserine kinase [Canibacter zhuwentaonis]MBT1034782.1 homoserine kinase [Canibacter zhuwentaonis]
MTAQVKVWVPATSANLGPGFDALGLALEYGDTYTVTVVESAEIRVKITGQGAATLPTDGSNLIARSIAHVYASVGKKMPGLEIEAQNNIPHGRGMGSSAAAIVGGVMLAAKLLSRDSITLTKDELFQLASNIEGHPDNVAPAIYGGLTISWQHQHAARTARLDVLQQLAPTLIVPDYEVATSAARALQPESVPYAEAVFNLSRAALLIASLTRDPDLIFDATADQLHQPYRAKAMQRSYDLMLKLREKGFAAVISGAGPSILVLQNTAAIAAVTPGVASGITSDAAVAAACAVSATSGGASASLSSASDATLVSTAAPTLREIVRAQEPNWELKELTVNTDGARIEEIH